MEQARSKLRVKFTHQVLSQFLIALDIFNLWFDEEIVKVLPVFSNSAQ